MSNNKIGLILLSLVLAIATYWSGLAEAFNRWSNEEAYSYGFLIPFVTLYILWEKRSLIKQSIGPPLWTGLLLIVISTITYIVGELSALYVLVQYAFVLTLVGISLLTVGKATRFTLAPILLLLFAVPLPYVIQVVLTAKLQLLSSWLGVEFIRAFHIPVFLEGNVIDLGNYQLQVAEACSGLRYLFPLMSLGFIAAYFYQAVFWKRSIVFLATIPITILMNSFRIGAIGVLVNHWGISMAEGFLHEFEGWIIFMACAILLLALILIMERLTTKNSLASVFGVVEENAAPISKPLAGSDKKSALPVIIMLLLMISSMALTRFVDNREEHIPLHKAFVDFPMQIGDWTGIELDMAQQVQKKLAMTDYLLANYINKNDRLVNFYVAYYATQRKGASPHSPSVCIPGGGWEIADFKRIMANGHPVNRVLIKKGTQAQLVYYWFQGHGRIVANEYINKWYLLEDSIFKNRTDGSLVRVVTPVAENEDIKQADQRLLNFMSVAEPELKNYIAD